MSRTGHSPTREKRSSARKSVGSQFFNRVSENEHAILNINSMVSLEQSRVKFVMLWPSSKLDVTVPDQKKNIALLKSFALKNWKVVANAEPKHSELGQYILKALICGVSCSYFRGGGGGGG